MQESKEISLRLIRAVRYGKLEEISQLINSYGLDHSEAQGYVLLRSALEKGDSAVAKLLLTCGASVNKRNFHLNPCNTPLHFAVMNGDVEVVETLLDKNANVHAKNKEDRSPLDEIEYTKNGSKITELLLKHGANPNAKDRYGDNLIHVAVRNGSFEIIQQLLNYGVDVNSMCKQNVPLHLAVEYDHQDIVLLLLNRGALVDIKGADDITPLHIATRKGNEQIVKDLLNRGACIQSLTLQDRYTPLHFACESRTVEIIKLLLNKGADVNACTKNNLTPLHMALQKGYEEFVKLLLQHRGKVDSQGKTTLQYAIEKESLTYVKDMLKFCQDINNKSNRSCFETAVQGNEMKYNYILQAILECGYVTNTEDATNPELLQDAVKTDYLDAVEILLQNGVDVNSNQECHPVLLYEVLTTLHRTVQCRQAEVVQLLIKYGADVNAKSSNGNTPIRIAIETKSIKVVKALLEHDVNATDNYGITALHLTAFGLRSASCRILYHEDLNNEIAKLLISKGANIEAKTQDGETALHIAVKNNIGEMCLILLQAGANVNAIDKCGRTALHTATETFLKERIQIVEILLKFGADVNMTDKSGRTALHIASIKGNSKLVITLLEYGADINLICKSGRTPLHFAYMNRQQPTESFKTHIIKMKAANLYVSARNLQCLDENYDITFEHACADEITKMKSEKIKNSHIAFYEILAKNSDSLAAYMRNENLVMDLQSGRYKLLFPLYASMIECNFRKGMERKELLEEGNKIIYLCLNNLSELPNDCIEHILSYLSNQDLRGLKDVYKSFRN